MYAIHYTQYDTCPERSRRLRNSNRGRNSRLPPGWTPAHPQAGVNQKNSARLKKIIGSKVRISLWKRAAKKKLLFGHFFVDYVWIYVKIPVCLPAGKHNLSWACRREPPVGVKICKISTFFQSKTLIPSSKNQIFQKFFICLAGIELRESRIGNRGLFSHQTCSYV